MTPASELLSDDIRRRAAAPELWLLRAQRASRLGPTTFGISAGLVVAVIASAAGLDPHIPPALAKDFIASGAFFGVSIGMIAGILPRVFTANLADVERLRPLVTAEETELDEFMRALSRLTRLDNRVLIGISVAIGLLHAWLLGQWTLPPVARALQVGGTLSVWIAMASAIVPLIMNARLVDRLGSRVTPHPLDSAATAPFGRIALRGTLLIIGLQCAYPILVLGGDQSLGGATLIGIGVSLVSMAGMFWIPLRCVRKRKAEARSIMLDHLDVRVRRLLGPVQGALEDAPAGNLQELTSVLALRERIAEASTWPLDLAGFRRVLIYIIAPPVTWAAAALVEMAIDRSI